MEFLKDPLFVTFGLISAVCALLYYFGTSTYSYWKNLGVAHLEPRFPLLGNFYESVLSLKPAHFVQVDIYNKMKDKRFVGVFSLRKPTFFVRDPELIESILIKDFSVFYNRGFKVNTELNPLSAHLFNLENAKWKNLRNKLTPTFTSGKLKGMHQQLIGCSDGLMEHVKSLKGSPFEAREVMAKFTTDVISSCAFGLNANAMNDPDSLFRKIGKNAFRISFLAKIRVAIMNQWPAIVSLLRWKTMAKQMEDFFINTVINTIEYREKNKIERPDFLHLLNELRKQEVQNLQNGKLEDNEKQFVFDDKLLTSNAFVFFVAGFETTASILGYALYELAINQDKQKKLYEEVSAILKKYENRPTYEAVKEMKYLGQVISETLRKYPPVPNILRENLKPYKVPDSSLVLPKGTPVQIPIYALHHDPEHFPEPEKFLPERFSEQNAINMKKNTYLPFGDGPRICIGMRFARLEIKVALSRIISRYVIKPSNKTISPLQFEPRAFLLVPKGGLWLNVERREKTIQPQNT